MSKHELPEDVVGLLNDRVGGFNKIMGLRFVRADQEAIEAELVVDEQHLQPYGLVHGGVYCGLIETLCSTGAALSVWAEGKTTVGLENTTSFLRAVRSGTLRGSARPLVQGRRSQVWLGEIHDDRGRLAAAGRVRLLVLEPGDQADGVAVGLQTTAQPTRP
jgi:1,4-dihydroxy-2-naphthoyl-CoA hydrolase